MCTIFISTNGIAKNFFTKSLINIPSRSVPNLGMPVFLKSKTSSEMGFENLKFENYCFTQYISPVFVDYLLFDYFDLLIILIISLIITEFFSTISIREICS